MAQEEHDRGYIAWSQVAASFLIQFCTLGLGNSYGVFQSYYELNLLSSYSRSNIAWIGTTQVFLLSIIGIISGSLYDKGYVRSLMYVGTFLNILGLLGTSFAEKFPYIFLAYGIALGIGCGLLYVPAQAAIQAFFSTNAPLATGISMAGSSIGGVVYPLIFRQLQVSVGFPWTCRVFALVNCVLLGISCLLIRPRAREEEGVKATFDWQALRDWKLLLFGACALVLNIGIDVPFYFTPIIVHEKLGLPLNVGDALLAGLNGSSFLGRLFLNWIAGSYFGPLITWQFTILGLSVLLFSWFAVANLAGMVAFVIAYGVLVGGSISLIPSSVGVISPNPNVLGTRIGLVEGFQGVGFLIGPPIAGAILESSAKYLGVSMFCGALYFLLFWGVGVFTWGHHTYGSHPEENVDNLELQRVKANNEPLN